MTHPDGEGVGGTERGGLLLVQDLQVRVVNAATGELLRELVIDPTRHYQPIHPIARQHNTTPNPR